MSTDSGVRFSGALLDAWRQLATMVARPLPQERHRGADRPVPPIQRGGERPPPRPGSVVPRRVRSRRTVIFGWSAQNRTAQADVYYLSGYLGMKDNYVVFPRDGEPTLSPRATTTCPTWSQVSFLDDVRWGGADNGVTVGEDLLARGLGELGAVGWMPYQQYESMRRTTGDRCSFRDVTREFRTIRLRKSDEELEWLKRGAGFTDAALAGLRCTFPRHQGVRVGGGDRALTTSVPAGRPPSITSHRHR